MDFYELNKIMNDSEYQCNEQSPPVSMSTQTPQHQVRVYKRFPETGKYDVYANFTTVQEALDYMRRMDFANDSWYIIDANGKRLQMNDEGTSLVVTYGLGTTNVPNP